MSHSRVIGAVAWIFVLATWACSSSSSSGTTSNLAACGTGTGSGGGSSAGEACGKCIQDKCASETNACFASAGKCDSWAKGGCKGIPDQTCQTCVAAIGTCEQTNCASQCASGGDAGGGGSTSASCTELSGCCSSLDASSKGSCEAIAASNVEASCAPTLSSYKASGLCGGSGGGGAGGGCAGLGACCGSLAGDMKTGCEDTVAAKNDANCDMALNGMKSAGMCK